MKEKNKSTFTSTWLEFKPYVKQELKIMLRGVAKIITYLFILFVAMFAIIGFTDTMDKLNSPGEELNDRLLHYHKKEIVEILDDIKHGR